MGLETNAETKECGDDDRELVKNRMTRPESDTAGRRTLQNTSSRAIISNWFVPFFSQEAKKACFLLAASTAT